MPEPTNAEVQNQQVEQPVLTVPTPTPAEVATPAPVVEAQGQGTGQEPKALTEQQILDLIEKRATEIAQKQSLEAIKQAQSLTDKLGARISKEFEDRQKAFEAVSGQPLTDSQKFLLEKQTREQIIKEQQPQPQAPVQDASSHPLYPIVQKLSVKYGVPPIDSSDPEFITVNAKGDWDEWRDTFERGMKSKADRLAPKKTPSTEAEGDPKARIATTPNKGTAGIPDNLSATDYFKLAYKK